MTRSNRARGAWRTNRLVRRLPRSDALHPVGERTPCIGKPLAGASQENLGWRRLRLWGKCFHFCLFFAACPPGLAYRHLEVKFVTL